MSRIVRVLLAGLVVAMSVPGSTVAQMGDGTVCLELGYDYTRVPEEAFDDERALRRWLGRGAIYIRDRLDCSGVSDEPPPSPSLEPTSPPPAVPSKAMWPDDTSLLWRFVAEGESIDCSVDAIFAVGACWGMIVEATEGCESSLTVVAQVMDQDDFVIAEVTDSVGRLLPGQEAKLSFVSTERGAMKLRPLEVTCE